MKADDIDHLRIDGIFGQHPAHKIGLQPGKFSDKRCGRLPLAKGRPQSLPKCGIIGGGAHGPVGKNTLSIRFDDRRINPVERRAAHQPEGTERFIFSGFLLN